MNVLKLEKQNFKDWNNTEIFITLQPCDSYEGKQTPSCTNLIISKKFKKLWIGQTDPHFDTKNIQKIKEAGIEVEILNGKNCEKINPFFKKYITQKSPYITLKIAQSLNGKITHKNTYITNKKSLEVVHKMRSQYSYILTTTQTILKDNPLLNCRLPHQESNPHLIILGKQKIPSNYNIFKIKKG